MASESLNPGPFTTTPKADPQADGSSTFRPFRFRLNDPGRLSLRQRHALLRSTNPYPSPLPVPQSTYSSPETYLELMDPYSDSNRKAVRRLSYKSSVIDTNKEAGTRWLAERGYFGIWNYMFWRGLLPKGRPNWAIRMGLLVGVAWAWVCMTEMLAAKFGRWRPLGYLMLVVLPMVLIIRILAWLGYAREIDQAMRDIDALLYRQLGGLYRELRMWVQF